MTLKNPHILALKKQRLSYFVIPAQAGIYLENETKQKAFSKNQRYILNITRINPCFLMDSRLRGNDELFKTCGDPTGLDPF